MTMNSGSTVNSARATFVSGFFLNPTMANAQLQQAMMKAEPRCFLKCKPGEEHCNPPRHVSDGPQLGRSTAAVQQSYLNSLHFDTESQGKHVFTALVPGLVGSPGQGEASRAVFLFVDCNGK